MFENKQRKNNKQNDQKKSHMIMNKKNACEQHVCC